jgi:hypothetical protein
MKKASIYYWKDSKWMQTVQSEEGYPNKGDPRYPNKGDLKLDYVRLPIRLDIKDTTEQSLDDIYKTLNVDEINPMGEQKMQEWLKANGVKHTSMSCGDIIEVEGKYFICDEDERGWTELKELE